MAGILAGNRQLGECFAGRAARLVLPGNRLWSLQVVALSFEAGGKFGELSTAIEVAAWNVLARLRL